MLLLWSVLAVTSLICCYNWLWISASIMPGRERMRSRIQSCLLLCCCGCKSIDDVALLQRLFRVFCFQCALKAKFALYNSPHVIGDCSMGNTFLWGTHKHKHLNVNFRFVLFHLEPPWFSPNNLYRHWDIRIHFSNMWHMQRYMCVCVCYLCPRHGSKWVGGSQDGLVVHDSLRGHHGNAPHLMCHLRRELVGGQVGEGTGIDLGSGQEMTRCFTFTAECLIEIKALYHSINRHLGWRHGKSYWCGGLFWKEDRNTIHHFPFTNL